MKAGALNDGGAGLVYRGSLVFRRDSLGMLSFESALIAAGRITAGGVRYHVTDHLGSVRAVVDGATGNLLEASDYEAYGLRSDAANLPSGLSVSTPSAGEAPCRYHYTGQEDQLTVPYTDFGARHYSPALRRWLVPDPLSEKYYDVSPYAYCAGDPVNCVDVGGEKIIFVHGWPHFGAKPGRRYWGESFIKSATRVLKDNHTDVASYDYKGYSTAKQRRIDGYEYAKANIKRLTSNMDEGESFRFVTHSMGAAFSEGMADYLRDNGYSVDIMIHLSPFQAGDIETKSVYQSDIMTIDYQTIGDLVLSLGGNSQGVIKGADVHFLSEPKHSLKQFWYIHTESLYNSTWDELSPIINNF